VDASLKLLKAGRSILVFPEETRTRTGELLPFKPGAALLALRSGAPILPLGVAGTRRSLAPGSFAITPGRVALAVGPPIEVSGRTARDRDEVTRELRGAIVGLREEAARSLSS
jgi:1-acyl-sn-glycerol-3-phosphate acyltransferase